MGEILKAPKHLSKVSAEFWTEFASMYELEPHSLALLTMAAEALDRYIGARDRLAKEGITVPGREGGMRPHPCVAIERDARAAFAAIVKQLGLDDVAGLKRGPGRPAQPIGISWRTLNNL